MYWIGSYINGGYWFFSISLYFSIANLYYIPIPLLFQILDIPSTSINFAINYLRIIALSIPFQSAYNFYSATLRASGNSKLPVIAIGVACIINIILDYIFVGFFCLSVNGAAIATVIAQALSALFISCFYIKTEPELWGTFPNIQYIIPILKLSIAGTVQNSASAISMLLIQRLINGYGVDAIGGYTAAYKVESILTLPAANIGTALSVFVGQNMGAKKIDRAKQGLKASIRIAAIISVTAILIIWSASPVIIGIIVGNESLIIEIGSNYLYIASLTFPLCVILYSLTNFLRGVGEIVYPLFNTILELSVRTILAFVLSNYIGLYGIFLCRPISFIVSTISLSFRYKSNKWRN